MNRKQFARIISEEITRQTDIMQTMLREATLCGDRLAALSKLLILYLPREPEAQSIAIPSGSMKARQPSPGTAMGKPGDPNVTVTAATKFPAVRNPNRRPTHPGVMLWNDVLVAGHWSASGFADAVEISHEEAREIFAGMSGIGPNLAVRIQKACKVDAMLLLRMQASVDKWDVEHAAAAGVTVTASAPERPRVEYRSADGTTGTLELDEVGRSIGRLPKGAVVTGYHPYAVREDISGVAPNSDLTDFVKRGDPVVTVSLDDAPTMASIASTMTTDAAASVHASETPLWDFHVQAMTPAERDAYRSVFACEPCPSISVDAAPALTVNEPGPTKDVPAGVAPAAGGEADEVTPVASSASTSEIPEPATATGDAREAAGGDVAPAFDGEPAASSSTEIPGPGYGHHSEAAGGDVTPALEGQSEPAADAAQIEFDTKIETEVQARDEAARLREAAAIDWVDSRVNSEPSQPVAMTVDQHNKKHGVDAPFVKPLQTPASHKAHYGVDYAEALEPEQPGRRGSKKKLPFGKQMDASIVERRKAAIAKAEAEAPPPERTKTDQVLDLWSTTDMTGPEIAAKINCAPASVPVFVAAARRNNDPRGFARTIAGKAPVFKTPAEISRADGAPVSGASLPPPKRPMQDDKPVSGLLTPEEQALVRVNKGVVTLDFKEGKVMARGMFRAPSWQLKVLEKLNGGEMFSVEVLAKAVDMTANADGLKAALPRMAEKLADIGCTLTIVKDVGVRLTRRASV